MKSSFIPHPYSLLLAFVLGALTVAGFAPLYLFPLPLATLAGLFWIWARAATPRAAAQAGFAYGLGLFLCGVSWIYVSLNTFGALAAPMAAIVTFLLCAFLALLPAAAGYASVRFAASVPLRLGLLAPAAWALTEWVRGWIFTGFPWIALGYSQVPASPLAGYAPLLGIFGVSLAVAGSAGLLVMLCQRTLLRRAALLLAAIWLGGWGLKQAAWTDAVGPPVKVSLLQANIAQDLKWREDKVVETLESYRDLALSARSPLIVLPETALPLYLKDVPKELLAELAGHARRNGGDILIGVPELEQGQYFNSVVSIGTAPSQVYRKSHLVPFGEFIPLRPLLGWIVGMVVPLQDFSRGSTEQRPLAVAGQRVAVNICYEDAFGEEIIRQLPEATLLVNVSNVAWFGRSIAPAQHFQISQARALETGRAMLRATNTGITGVIGPDGALLAAAPEFTLATVTHTVQGYSGATPYVRWGNSAALALCLALIAAAVVIGRRAARFAA